jgi:hypothetical protein
MTTATVCCVCTADCCAPSVVICRRARAYEELNLGQIDDIFKIKSDRSYACKELNFTTFNIKQHVQTYIFA